MNCRAERIAKPRRLWIAAVLALLAACPAAAAATPSDPAAELAGLFMQSCNRFVGNARGLRDWAVATGLPELPRQGEAAFLAGASGKVFDATDAAGKFVVASQDNGPCSAIAEAADGGAVVRALEQALHDSGIAFTLAAETDDAAEKALRHREYVVSQDRQAWQILVSFVFSGQGAAMLTAQR